MLLFLGFLSQVKADGSNIQRLNMLIQFHNYWLSFQNCVKIADWKEEGHVMGGYGYSILDLDLSANEPEEPIFMFHCSYLEEYLGYDIFNKEQHLIKAIESRYNALMMRFQECAVMDKSVQKEEMKSCFHSIRKEAQSHHEKGFTQKYNEEVDFLQVEGESKNHHNFVFNFKGFDFLVSLTDTILHSLESNFENHQGHH